MSDLVVQPSVDEGKGLGTVAHLLSSAKPGGRQARLVGPDGKEHKIPNCLYEVLREAAEKLSAGTAITVLPLAKALTTQQAADQLNVSRPFLIKILDAGKLPFHRAGTHRRIMVRDLLAFKREREIEVGGILAGLTADAQSLGLYDED